MKDLTKGSNQVLEDNPNPNPNSNPNSNPNYKCEEDSYGSAYLFFHQDRNFESAWKICERYIDLAGSNDFGNENDDHSDMKKFFGTVEIKSETHGKQLFGWTDQVSGYIYIIVIWNKLFQFHYGFISFYIYSDQL